MLPPQPTSTLFPYTTLFRSPSSPKRFVQLLGNLKSYGNTQGFALDVCPHCTTFPRLNTNSMLAPADVLQIWADRKSTRLNSSHRCISYAVFCLKKKNKRIIR